MDEVLKAFEMDIEYFTLVPSDGGKFELIVNDSLVYSKLQTNRHMETGEASLLIQKYIKENA